MYQTLFRHLLTRSAYLMRATVCFFNQSVIAFASFVRLHLGLFLKSMMRENGKAVIPKAPQQASMGQPMRQSKPMRKQGTVVTIQIDVLVVAWVIQPPWVQRSVTVISQKGIKTLPQKSQPMPRKTPKTAMVMMTSTMVQSTIFQQESSSSASQSEEAMGLRKAILARILKQTANQRIVKLEPELRLELTSKSRKRGCSSTCSRVMRMRILQITDRGLHIGYYLWVYRMMKQMSTSSDIMDPMIVTTRVSTSIFDYQLKLIPTLHRHL